VTSGLKRVLVANRGEIAVRVIDTLDRLGIESVAVYSEVDAGARHVRRADASVLLGPGPAAASYLQVEAVLAAARATGADAVHPGYGFLSENAAFAAAVEAEGLVFLGPTPDQIEVFGDKHRARAVATAAGVPLLAGSGLLEDLDAALGAAGTIGYPVMLKSSAGGGGIGMQVCRSAADLRAAYDQVRRTATASFGSGEVYLERYVDAARHVEVQVFGDGLGRVVVLGDRDCSAQRRHQKIVEECPAPGLSDRLRRELHDAAHQLMASVGYRSAGTVEFIVDAERGDAAFLEVNTRLQVEHPVTEAVWGIDLVEWMVRLGGGDDGFLDAPLQPAGHAVEARIYAEDPARGFRPSSGVLTEVVVPEGVRLDTWVETGTEVSPFYDPLLAKVVVHGADRAAAIDRLTDALAHTRLAGIETNVAFLRDLVADPAMVAGRVVTSTAAAVVHRPATIEVLDGGDLSTVQDHPGRLGYWAVGVPPSGPMDARSFRLANRIVGNACGAPGLELTVRGPTLRFDVGATICLAGASMPAHVETADGSTVAVTRWRPVEVAAGSTLVVGGLDGPGCRAYLAVRGGIDVPSYLGSAATFTLGGFGGHAGRALRAGDVLHIGDPAAAPDPPRLPAPEAVPVLSTDWEIGVLAGPHAAPDYFTPGDIEQLYASTWEVHFNSARTGIRLLGPAPTWARSDGGDAGLHPSNINDTPYAVGTLDFTGDMPIILGPDGPSLGGFVCPATTASAERWKLGQLRPGDRVRFVPWSLDRADAALTAEERLVATLAAAPAGPTPRAGSRGGVPGLPGGVPGLPGGVPGLPGGVQGRLEATGDRPAVTYRQDGDRAVLVEYGPDVLDLDLRFRVHALMTWVQEELGAGVVDLTPGIRSLQVHVDPATTSTRRVLGALVDAEAELPGLEDMTVPTRIVHLPLSWDDPATVEATERYMQVVRSDAPWCPHNLEFIRRINGLASIEDVRRVVFDANYLVLGLGDVYLGAPVATPLDPRHRLVTTKYNPARTWTPENAVGIGGAYLCIYGMEGPGGYQFVGRTVPVWNTWRSTRHFEPDRPWLLRFFDQLRFYPVAPEELLDMRRDLLIDRMELRIDEETFSLADYHRFLDGIAEDTARFRSTQQAAFAAERAAWEASGELDRVASLAREVVGTQGDERAEPTVPAGGALVRSPLGASVWQVPVVVGDTVEGGEPVVVLEAMKTETAVPAPAAGVVVEVLVRPGQVVSGGHPLVVLGPSGQPA
jgi:urea carboxylase